MSSINGCVAVIAVGCGLVHKLKLLFQFKDSRRKLLQNTTRKLMVQDENASSASNRAGPSTPRPIAVRQVKRRVCE